MITSEVVAHVRRLLRGHSDRALVHAVDADGLEYKLEVPLDQVRALDESKGFVVTITYALHVVPGLAPPSSETPASSQPANGATAPAPAPAPVAGGAAMGADAATVDAQFMALMNRRPTAAAPSAENTAPESSQARGPAPTAGSSIDAVVDEFFGLR